MLKLSKKLKRDPSLMHSSCSKCAFDPYFFQRINIVHTPYPAARKDAVLLTQRAPGAALMPRMWELPPADPSNGSLPRRPKVLLRLRHSITDTDYRVTVLRGGARTGQAKGRWVRLSRLPRMPLTGLARKILRRSNLLA